MSTQPKGRGWGHIAFGADPVGVHVASCLHHIFKVTSFDPKKIVCILFLEQNDRPKPNFTYFNIGKL